MSNNYFSIETEFPANHVAITPSDSVNLFTDMVIRAGTAGTVSITDGSGSTASYTAAAGELLPIIARRVNLTGTSSTGLVGFY